MCYSDATCPLSNHLFCYFLFLMFHCPCSFIVPDVNRSIFFARPEGVHGQDNGHVAEPSTAQYSSDTSEITARNTDDTGRRYSMRIRGRCGQAAFIDGSNEMSAADHEDKEDAASSRWRKQRIGGTKLMCGICNVVFPTRSARFEHFRKFHTGENHECLECGKSFANSSSLGRHLLSHNVKRTFACHICKKTFKKNVLKKHQKTHDNRHECSFCGKSFLGLYELRRHEKIHTDERSHKCEICGKGFIQKGVLRTHYLTHTKEKPYKCGICQRGFARKDVLNKHALTHTGEKPFGCDQCGVRYARKDALKEHQAIHKEKYEHRCGVCQTDYPTKAKLAFHIRFSKCGRNNNLGEYAYVDETA